MWKNLRDKKYVLRTFVLKKTKKFILLKFIILQNFDRYKRFFFANKHWSVLLCKVVHTFCEQLFGLLYKICTLMRWLYKYINFIVLFNFYYVSRNTVIQFRKCHNVNDNFLNAHINLRSVIEMKVYSFQFLVYKYSVIQSLAGKWFLRRNELHQ